MTDRSGMPADRVDISALWFAKGAGGSLSLGLVVLSLSFVGFGAFARDAGFPLWQVVFMSVSVWALPSALVFVAALAGGASVVAAGIAVALSAVRLLPMTIAVMPLFGATDRIRRVWLVIAVHYVAVTAYVEGFLKLPKVPEEHRLAYFIGLGTGLMVIATCFGAVGYLISGYLPVSIGPGLVILSPLYFLLSMLKAATTVSEKFALAAGLIFGPIAHSFTSQFDLLIGGGAAGIAGYLAERWRRKRVL